MHNLLHNIWGNDQLKILHKILEDGFLKSSSKTKNVQLYGLEKGSPYIFLTLPIGKNMIMNTLILDEKLLLEHTFYLHTGWSGEVDKDEKKYIGKEFTHLELSKILNKFEKDIHKYLLKSNEIYSFYSNEILVKNNISLKKYLREIKIVKQIADKNPKILENIINIIKTKYKNVKITLV
jgi:hypothetical protein